MKHYEVWGRLSGGSVMCDPLDAEDVEGVKKVVLERTPEALRRRAECYPDEVLEEIEIYELVSVAVIDFRPRVVV